MTTGEYIFEALGGVGGDLIDMAEKITFPRSLWRRAVPWAACLAVLAGMAAGVWYLLPQTAVEPAELAEVENPAEPPALPEDADTAEAAFPDVLVTTSSGYSLDVGVNLALACQALNGAVVEPGEVFSFNDTVGARTAERGYVVAMDSGDGEEMLGGGVSQAASTLYMAALSLGLEQVEREPHPYCVPYVPGGMDAAVYYGTLDYRFRNTMDHAIRIDAWLEDGTVYVRLLGVREEETTASLSCEILETSLWETVEQVDETKPAGYRELAVSPITGYQIAVYRTVYDADGRALSTEEVGISTYQKRDAVYVVGSGDVN